MLESLGDYCNLTTFHDAMAEHLHARGATHRNSWLRGAAIVACSFADSSPRGRNLSRAAPTARGDAHGVLGPG
eukprot:10626498-Alexandrium_andersonii.AAC.1